MSEVENITPCSIHFDEILIRILYHPDHIDDSGKIKPSAMPSDHFKVGVSVDRKKYANKNYIEQNIQDSVSRKEGKSLAGFGLIKHEVVLNINDSNKQPAFYVNANPIANNEAHALIFLKNSYQPAEIKKLRKALIDEFNLIKNLEEALR